MLPVPSLKGIPASVPLQEILLKTGLMQDAVVKRERFYLEFGGDHKLRWEPDTALTTMLSDLADKNKALLETALKKYNKHLESKEEGFGVYAYDIDTDPAIMQAGITVFIGIEDYVILCISFLKQLRESRPEIFKLVKSIIECIYLCPLAPMSTLDRFYENYYEGMVFDDQHSDIDEEFKKAVKTEAAEFNRLFEPGRYGHAKHFGKKIESLEREFKRLGRLMNQDERSWIKQALELFHRGVKVEAHHDAGHLCFIQSDSDDGAPAEDAFCILLHEQSNITCDWEESISNEAMSVGAPIIKFLITSKADLAAVREYDAFLFMLQKVMYSCYKLVKEGKVWKI
jgi:hypothetical protein